MDDRIKRKRLIRTRKQIGRYLNSTKILILVAVIGFFIVFMIDKFAISVITVDGDSMQNTLFENDKILVQRLGIKSSNIKIGDIVYFQGDDERYYLKRVVAISGDVLEIINNKVLVNGVQKDEYYTQGDLTIPYSQNKWFLKQNEFFVLGDNRVKNSSKDSRIFGPIRFEQIKGKVIYNFNSER